MSTNSNNLVVGVLGYKGQSVTFLSATRFSMIQGNSIYVASSDSTSDSPEMIWRAETGISSYAWSNSTELLAVAPSFGSTEIDILKLAGGTTTRETSLVTSGVTIGRITDMTFSKSGDRLFALTDASQSLVLCWDVSTGVLLFSQSLDNVIYKHVIVNPSNESVFTIFGDEGIKVGVISDVMGTLSVRLQTISIEPDFRFEDSDVSAEVRTAAVTAANHVTCAVWMPFDRLVMGNLQGNILEAPIHADNSNAALRISVKSSLKKHTTYGKSSSGLHATQMVLSNSTMIVSTSVGIVFWFATHPLSTSPSSAESIMVDSSMPLQIATMDGYISALAIDPQFQRIIVGTFIGELISVNVQLQERPTEERDDDAYQVSDTQTRVDDTPLIVVGENVFGANLQSGAILCSAAMAIPNNINKKHLPIFVMSSQVGSLSFWMQPEQHDSPNKLYQQTLLANFHIVGDATSSSETTPIVCSMVPLPFRRKGSGQLLCVGLDSGIIQILEVSAEFGAGDDEEKAARHISAKRIASRRFFYSPVTDVCAATLAFGRGRHCLAVASSEDNCVYVVDLFNTSDGYAFDVQQVFKLGNALLPTSMLWNGFSLCVCANDGSVHKFSIEVALQSSDVAADFNYPSPQLSFAIAGCRGFIQPCLMTQDHIVGAGVGSSDLLAVTLSSGGGHSAPITSSSIHSDALICCTKCPHNQLVATGCADGSVYIWKIENGKPGTIINHFTLHAGPVISLAFSADSSILFSAASDGSYFFTGVSIEKSTLIEPSIMKPNEMGITDAEFTMASIADSKTWLEQRKLRLFEELKLKNETKYQTVDSALSILSTRLQYLLDENSERTELEKMERGEFVVDMSGQDTLLSENDKRVENVRNSYFKLNAWNELIAARVRQTCWDSMATQSRQLLPLLDESQTEALVVSSMPVRKCSDDEVQTLERVKRLRAIELRSQQKDPQGTVSKLPSGKSRCTWSTAIQGCPEITSWISFDGARWPCSDVIEMINEKEKEDAAKAVKTDAAAELEEAEVSLADDDDGSQAADGIRDVDDNDVFNLLYPPQCVRTQTQKRTQIILFKEVGRMIRSKFNVHFDRLVREKEDVMSSVESRNLRIRAILEELKQQDEFLDPKWKEVEIADSAIVVSDDEVVSRPYESEVQRAARFKEEEERRRREAEKDKEDVKGRALEEMMNGTLEVKRDVFAEASSLQRPAWMDEIPVSDMTDSQLKELDAFEVRFKALQEEQAKYRKTLEVELKKLKAEAIEVCKAFDEKLVVMVKLKVLVQQEVLSQELYISRISQSMAQRDQLWQLLKKNEGVIDSTRIQRNDLRAKIDAFSVEVEKIRGKLTLAQEEERTMEKGFKRDLQNLCNVSFDQDQLKVFTQLYHIRVYPTIEERDEDAEESEVIGTGKATDGKVVKSRKPTDPPSPGLQSDSLMDSQSFDGFKDPFYFSFLQQLKSKRTAEAEIPLLVPLDLTNDCPEAFEVDQFTWSKLQELRSARIEKEIECSLLSREYGELKRKLDQICSEESLILSCLKDLVSIKEETTSTISNLENNLTVLVSIKQGQDEVDKEAIVTDYSSSALVPVEVIRKFNGRIKEHGKEKIGVLNRIKTFRRKINILDWEAKHLSLESHHYNEYYTDLQLLRVTRDLQHVIRDGSNAEQAKARIDRVGARKDFLQKDADERIRKLKRANEALRRLVKGRTDESNSLKDKIQKLAGEVDARQSVLQSRDDARGSTGNPAASAQLKMKKVMARRHLVDTARAQAEEIDFLRQELDRARQRTFPSFVRAAQRRTGHGL